MKINLAGLESVSSKILAISDELSLSNSSITESINYAQSSLVSVQSYLDQLRAALTGDYGLVTLLDWHKAESGVVSASLKDLAGVVGAQDADLSDALDGFYRDRGAEQNHSPFYMPEVTSLGKGFETKDGRRFHTLTGHGIPLADEPLGGMPILWRRSLLRHRWICCMTCVCLRINKQKLSTLSPLKSIKLRKK